MDVPFDSSSGDELQDALNRRREKDASVIDDADGIFDVSTKSAVDDGKPSSESSGSGILPLGQSSSGIHTHPLNLSDWYFGHDLHFRVLKSSIPKEFEGWVFPGTENIKKESCGSWVHRGCMNVELHRKDSLGQIHGREGEVYGEGYQLACYNKHCTVCARRWAVRETKKAMDRIDKYKHELVTKEKPIHVQFSVSPKDYGMTYKQMKVKLNRVMKAVGMLGGVVILHLWRKNKWYLPKQVRGIVVPPKTWYFAPHFHVVGFGWVEHADDVYRRTGWVSKNIGLRKTVFGTITYQLSHCAVNDKYHTTFYFGGMSYNKLRFSEEEKQKMKEKRRHKCPWCGHDLVRMRWTGKGKHPLDGITPQGAYCLIRQHFEDWAEVVSKWKSG